MRIFNDKPTLDIDFERREDAVLVHFEDDTLGFNTTTGGYSITPDWNDQRFTLAFSEDSVLYHLTNESKDEKWGSGNIQPEGFIAEVYTAVRTLAPVFPLSHLDVEKVGKVDLGLAEDFLRDWSVISRSGKGYTVNGDNKKELERAYEEDPNVREEFFDKILTKVPISDIEETGDNIFVVLNGESRPKILFLFPDGYVGIITPEELLYSLDDLTAARSLDLLLQAISGE